MTLPGIARSLVKRQSALKLSLAASGAAFWLVLGLFPAGLAAVNILGLVVDQQVIANYLGRLAEQGPGTLGYLLATQLGLIARPSPGTGLIDTILVIISLWSVSTAVGQLIAGTRAAFGLRQPSFTRRRIQALIIGFGVVLVLPFLAYLLADASSSRPRISLLAVVIAVLAITGTYVAASGRQRPLRSHLPGLAFATVAIIGITLLFTLLVRRSGTYEAIYGAVAGSVITMIAVWLMVYAVLLGALLNTLLSEKDDVALGVDAVAHP